MRIDHRLRLCSSLPVNRRPQPNRSVLRRVSELIGFLSLLFLFISRSIVSSSLALFLIPGQSCAASESFGRREVDRIDSPLIVDIAFIRRPVARSTRIHWSRKTEQHPLVLLLISRSRSKIDWRQRWSSRIDEKGSRVDFYLCSAPLPITKVVVSPFSVCAHAKRVHLPHTSRRCR